MIGLLQRVNRAEVRVGDSVIASVGRGLVVLVGVERGDTDAEAERLAERLMTYRVFPDEQGRMNLPITKIGGGLLLVPQFTLAADTRSGSRPSFTPAADPGTGRRLFAHLVERLRSRGYTVATGEFGVDMQLELTNDGPVTFWLQVRPVTSTRHTDRAAGTNHG